MPDRLMESSWFKLAMLIVPPLISFAGSYSAVQVALRHKVERSEYVAETAALRGELTLIRSEFNAHLGRHDDWRERLGSELADLKTDMRAIRCALLNNNPAVCR